jgi:hypothetical protein
VAVERCDDIIFLRGMRRSDWKRLRRVGARIGGLLRVASDASERRAKNSGHGSAKEVALC